MPTTSLKTLEKQMDGAELSKKLREARVLTGKQSDAGLGRHYKHAAGKSETYSPVVVDMIYRMSREGPFSDEEVSEFVQAKLKAEQQTTAESPPLTWDQLTFMSANLTRLVIDPYREPCDSHVQIGPERPAPLMLDAPIVIGGVAFEQLPSHIGQACGSATIANQLGLFAPAGESLSPEVRARTIAQLELGEPLPDLAGYGAVEITALQAARLAGPEIGQMVEAVRESTDGRIPIGVTTPANNAQTVIDAIVAAEPDFVVADAQWQEESRPVVAVPELLSAPDISVLADVIDRLRHHRREELIQVIYRGGIRGGADAGKALCIGASAVTIGLSAIIGMGFKLVSIKDEASLLKTIEPGLAADTQATGLINFAKSVLAEVTMLARACGKSSIVNMEPEDLRALTIAASQASGIPLTGKDYNFRMNATTC